MKKEYKQVIFNNFLVCELKRRRVAPDKPLVILEVNHDFLNKDDEFMFERDLNLFITSGNKRLESMIASGKKSAAVYLLRMEEILPYIVHGQENFVGYWNEKLESFCDRIR